MSGQRNEQRGKVSGKKTCFHHSKIKKLVWFLHQPPHFSYEKSNSEGTQDTAAGERQLREVAGTLALEAEELWTHRQVPDPL